MARSKSETSAAFRAEIVDWLRDIHRRTAMPFDQIAGQAGVSPSTLYRWMDEKRTDTPSHATLTSLSEAFGVPIPGHRPLTRPAGALAEHGVLRLDPPDVDMPEKITQSWWRVRDRSLELAGFLPGDRILVDRAVDPRRGDGVVAEIYNMDARATENVLRVFAFPALVTRSADPFFADTADVIDGARVKVAGTVVRLIRDLSH